MFKLGQFLKPADPAKATWHPLTIMLLASVWLASVGNVALWRALAQLPGHSVWFDLGFALMIACVLCAMMCLLPWRPMLKPLVTLLLIASASGAYFMLTYGVVIDATMMQNVMQTDAREVRDLLSWRLIAYVLVLGVCPAIWLWRQSVRTISAAHYFLVNVATFITASMVLVITGMLVFQSLASVMRNHTQVRYLINPLNSVYAMGVLAAKPFVRNPTSLMPLGRDAQLAPMQGKPPLLVLVLGETARSINFGVNGYARDTTPYLAQENIVSQRNAWSCGTSTAASVPCMFSHLGREHFDGRRENYENLVDVLQHAGLAVLWVDNQSGCKGVCDRVPSVNTSAMKVPGLCDGGECFDSVMLKDLNQRIEQLPAEKRNKGVVVFMHQMGSHGPAYFKRSPQALKKFLPECTSNALQQCERQALVNAYDNSIVYTDYFLAQTIEWLKSQQGHASPALIYVSDHGESLGENNLYLHGMPYRVAPNVQKHVPWVTWLSPQFELSSGLRTACLKQRIDTLVSHDNYFHSVLGVLGVQTSVYKAELDMYAACVR